jgi:hypothetical protein
LDCLLVQQPYASLIVFGNKRWEFRSYEIKRRGTIGIAASPSSVLPTRNRKLNASAAFFPRGVLLGTANLVNCFYATAADLKNTVTKPVEISMHGQQFFTLGPPIGEPREDVELAANSRSWASYVWELEDVKPLKIPIPVVKKLGSTWVSVNLDA